MNESLLQYIWKFRLYSYLHLKTLCGKEIIVRQSGTHNLHQGPDFINARIEIDGTVWAGNVELHILTSHWDVHKHSDDPNYRNVILHVVWKHDRNISVSFPTVEISPYVAKSMLHRFSLMMNNKQFIPCQTMLNEVDGLHIKKSLERFVMERLEGRADQLMVTLTQMNGDWHAVLWRLIFRVMGGKVNGFAFEQLLTTLPAGFLRKCKGESVLAEAVLMGQSNLLTSTCKDNWPALLFSIYQYQQKKFSLKPSLMGMHYFRMRPSSFPSIRLSMLAHLIARGNLHVQMILDAEDTSSIRQLMPIGVADYWRTHYRFDMTAKKQVIFNVKRIQESLLINAVIPLLYAYGRQTNQAYLQEKATNWLFDLKAEKHSITDAFESFGLKAEHAADSQGILQLYHEYCEKKRCLDCSLAHYLLKKSA